MNDKCTRGKGFCQVHQGNCEIHSYLMGDGRCSCQPCDLQSVAIYTFHRKDGFYPIELPNNDEQIIDHVCKNPGTLKVVNENTGVVVFDESVNQN